MKIIRTMMASLLLACCSAALADDYQYLTVRESGGETSFSVSKIQKITFDTANMVLHLTDGSRQELPLVGLQKMFFGTGSSGLSFSQVESRMEFSRGMLRATVGSGESIAVYNMKGVKVFSANESGSYDLSTLARGVYIIKVGNDTKKVVNK